MPPPLDPGNNDKEERQNSFRRKIPNVNSFVEWIITGWLNALSATEIKMEDKIPLIPKSTITRYLPGLVLIYCMRSFQLHSNIECRQILLLLSIGNVPQKN